MEVSSPSSMVKLRGSVSSVDMILLVWFLLFCLLNARIARRHWRSESSGRDKRWPSPRFDREDGECVLGKGVAEGFGDEDEIGVVEVEGD